MALVLDSTLAAAQNAQVRRPLAEIISGAFVPDVPFDGQLLTGGATAESRPNILFICADTHQADDRNGPFTFEKQVRDNSSHGGDCQTNFGYQ